MEKGDLQALREEFALEEEETAAVAAAAAAAEDEDEDEDEDEWPQQAEFDYAITFDAMALRRLRRRYKGVYKHTSILATVVSWMIVLYMLIVLGVFTVNTSPDKAKVSVNDAVFGFLSAIVVVYLLVKIAMVIRWMVYWAVFALITNYAISGHEDLDELHKMQKSLVITLIVVEVITVGVYLFKYHLYTWLVARGVLNQKNWWKVRRGLTSNTLTYQTAKRAIFFFQKRQVIQYCGGLDEARRPHGFGIWTDSSYHGESLSGQWDHGKPVGPFRSIERGSGYSFVNLRVAFCSIRSETEPTKINMMPSHHEHGLNWGVAAIECSVSGGFFTFLPSVEYLEAPEPIKNARDAEALLRTPADYVVFHQDSDDQPRHGSHPETSFQRSSNNKSFNLGNTFHLFREASCPILSSDEHSNKEALVFLHGYNCSTNYAINRFGQFLTLGDFPTHIHPFVFSWPSGSLIMMGPARRLGAESEQTSRLFCGFLRELIAAGYTRINIIAHSMGPRVFLKCLTSGMFNDIFIKKHETFGQDLLKSKAYLSTVTFCNPEYSVTDFVRHGGAFDQARDFTDHITIYADELDIALFGSEIFNRRGLFDSRDYSLGKRVEMIHRPLNEEPHTRLAQPAAAAAAFDGHEVTSMQRERDVAAAEINQVGGFMGVRSFAYNRARVSSRAQTEKEHAEKRVEAETRIRYLDVDVINTTWMENNVHSVRHNYFNLNPTIVDDLRELIVYKKRANARPGLMNIKGNVFIFLVAPSYIKNV